MSLCSRGSEVDAGMVETSQLQSRVIVTRSLEIFTIASHFQTAKSHSANYKSINANVVPNRFQSLATIKCGGIAQDTST